MMFSFKTVVSCKTPEKMLVCERGAGKIEWKELASAGPLLDRLQSPATIFFS